MTPCTFRFQPFRVLPFSMLLLVTLVNLVATPALAADKVRALSQCGRFTEATMINGTLNANLTAFYASPGMPPAIIDDMDGAFHIWIDQGQRVSAGCMPSKSVYATNAPSPTQFTAINRYDSNGRLRLQQLSQNNVSLRTLSYNYNALGQLTSSQAICDVSFQNLSGRFNYAFSYNADGTLASVVRTVVGNCPAGGGFLKFTYGEPRLPNMPTKIETGSTTLNVSYTANSGKVSQVAGIEVTLSFSYQGNLVNRMSSDNGNVDNYTYDSQTGQLLTDSNGAFNVITATYNNLQQLTQVAINTGIIKWDGVFTPPVGRHKKK